MAQSRGEALESLSNIPDIIGNDNVFVQDNTAYTRNISIEVEKRGLLAFSASFVAVLISSLFIISLLSGPPMISMVIPGLVAFMLLLLLSESLSFKDTICAFDTQDEVDYKINEFATYNPNNPFNEEHKVVELSLRDDNGIRIETDDGITWVIECVAENPSLLPVQPSY